MFVACSTRFELEGTEFLLKYSVTIKQTLYTISLGKIVTF